jgi:hypothetical protein
VAIQTSLALATSLSVNVGICCFDMLSKASVARRDGVYKLELSISNAERLTIQRLSRGNKRDGEDKAGGVYKGIRIN